MTSALESAGKARLVNGETMTETERAAYLHKIRSDYRLTTSDLSRHTGYARPSVKSFLSNPDSKAYRPTPARAVDRLAMEVALGRIVKPARTMTS